MSDLMVSPPRHALAVHPDSSRYRCIFDVGSQTSNRVYRISFDAAPGAMYWTCSCPGNIGRGGHCKHLEAMGLRGRKYGKNFAQLAAFNQKQLPSVPSLKEIAKKVKAERPVHQPVRQALPVPIEEPAFASGDALLEEAF